MSDRPSSGIAARVFDLVPGLDWPAGDEQQCRAAALAWNEMAKAIGAIGVAAASAREAMTSCSDCQIEIYTDLIGRIDGAYLPDAAQACRQMARSLEQYAEQVVAAKQQVIVECTAAGAAIIAGIGLCAVPVGCQFAAAKAAATAAALVATTGLIGATLAATSASIATTVLVGAPFGALSAMTIDLVTAPIRMVCPACDAVVPVISAPIRMVCPACDAVIPVVSAQRTTCGINAFAGMTPSRPDW